MCLCPAEVGWGGPLAPKPSYKRGDMMGWGWDGACVCARPRWVGGGGLYPTPRYCKHLAGNLSSAAVCRAPSSTLPSGGNKQISFVYYGTSALSKESMILSRVTF